MRFRATTHRFGAMGDTDTDHDDVDQITVTSRAGVVFRITVEDSRVLAVRAEGPLLIRPNASNSVDVEVGS